MIAWEKIYVHMPFFRLLSDPEKFCGFNVNCEIYFSSEALISLNDRQIKNINKLFDKGGIKRSIHAPFLDLNPAGNDNDVTQISLSRFKQCINACVKLKANRMVMHTHYQPIFYDAHKQKWLANAAKCWQPLASYAGAKGVAIATENSIEQSSWPALSLLKRVKGLKACFDVAHYNVFSPLGWEEELFKYPPRSVLEVHMSDNNGKSDEHLPLGEGNIDFKKFFNILRKRKMNPYITIEPHDDKGLVKGLRYIKKYCEDSKI